MTGVGRLLAARATADPDGIAFIDGASGRRLQWRDLALHAGRWETLARRTGLEPGRRVALVVDDPLTFAAGYLGCLAAGLTVVPLDPRGTAEELALATARLRVDVLAGGVEGPAGGPLALWTVAVDGPREIRPAPSGPRPGDAVALRPAALLASSGTTGDPKGVPLSERLLLDGARRVVDHHRLSPSERGYTPLPLFHVNAQVVGLLATVMGGGSLVVEARFDRDAYWDRVAAWRPTWLNAVPAVLGALVETPAPDARVVDGIRFARSASAPLPPAVLERFRRHTGVSVLETYGMTEVAGQIAANPLDPALRRPGSVGMPVGVDLEVATPDGLRAAPGELGSVRLRGAAVVTHYLELTASGLERVRPACDRRGWLTTGDLGRLDADGFLHLAGREDDVINRGGEKFHPQEVERVLLDHPAVAAAAVVGAPHPRLGQVAVAFVTVRGPAGDALASELAGICAQRLARYKRPVEIRVTPALPLGPTGKVRRRELRAALAA
ncbi:MAG TPA: AMP-binding protein [Candidatus Dormibacteraeota bacterium]